MGSSDGLMMKTKGSAARLLCLCGALLAASAVPSSASVITDFNGAYDVVHWTTTVTPGGSDGFVNTALAPVAVILRSGDNGVGAPSFVDFTIASVGNGDVSFSWRYTTNDVDGSFYDPFGYLLNGVFTQLTINGLFTVQTGSVTIPVSYGDVFGFRQAALDSAFGPAATRITDFSAPVPEPGSMLLLGSGIAGLALRRFRRRA